MLNRFKPKYVQLLKWITSNFESYIVDSYFISFPKSGRTWLKWLLQYYLEACYGGETATMCLNKTNEIYLHFKPLQFLKKSFPIIAFTHDVVDVPYQNILKYDQLASVFNPQRYFEKQNIFMMRDPRDVLVSYYHQKYHRAIQLGKNVNGVPSTLKAFAMNPVYGLPKIVEFMNLWAPVLTHHPDYFLAIRYEDLKIGVSTQAARLLTFLAGQVDQERLTLAIDWASFDKRKADEIKALKARGIDINGNDNALKVRKGAVGGYREELSPDLIGLVDKYITENLNPYYSDYIYYTFTDSGQP